MSHEKVKSSTFMYFGYGSNLLGKRIHLQNKSAIRKATGVLRDYELQFFGHSARWQGAPATIIENKGKSVWGAIWEINISNRNDLDQQEGVHDGIYIPLNLQIEISDMETINCRVYQLKNLPETLLSNNEIPNDRKPSKTYLKTIIKGAEESSLPLEYINFLKSFQDNGKVVENIEKELGL